MIPLPVEHVIRVPIRKISVVVDYKEPMAPELTLEEFRKQFGRDPEHERYRVLNVELITSPDDQQPMLVTECARYARFVRREANHVYFRMPIVE